MGFEAIASGPDSKANPQISTAGAAKASVAVCPPLPADPDLLAIVRVWSTLPQAIKAGVLALVHAAAIHRNDREAAVSKTDGDL